MEITPWQVSVLPNPSTNQFTLLLPNTGSGTLLIIVYDAVGRMIETRTGVHSGASVQIGHNYRPGTYFSEVVQGGNRQVLKLVKGAQ